MYAERPAWARQRGVALILAIWVLVLLTVLIGAYAVLARGENLEARNLFDGLKARYAAESGIHYAAYQMRNPQIETRWSADGRPYPMNFGGAEVEIRITDETGKVDINVAPAETLIRLLEGQGIETSRAEELAAAIEDWRDGDELTRPLGAEADDYQAAGYTYVPRNGPFATVDELQQVLGFDYELYRAVEPGVTVYSGRGQINPAFAPLTALLTMPEMTPEQALDFITLREQQDPQSGLPLTLPDGTAVLAQGGGLTYSVEARATLANHIFYDVRATIRLGTDYLGQPFRIVRWREGEYN